MKEGNGQYNVAPQRTTQGPTMKGIIGRTNINTTLNFEKEPTNESAAKAKKIILKTCFRV
jgi:hypothetical protein